MYRYATLLTDKEGMNTDHSGLYVVGLHTAVHAEDGAVLAPRHEAEGQVVLRRVGLQVDGVAVDNDALLLILAKPKPVSLWNHNDIRTLVTFIMLCRGGGDFPFCHIYANCDLFVTS